MAKFIDNNVTFNNVTTTGIKVSKNIVNAGTDLSDPSDPYIEPLINAVEIDWNGAQVGDKTINTTGELLSIIKEMQNGFKNIEVTIS